jgi:hypothetical protein
VRLFLEQFGLLGFELLPRSRLVAEALPFLSFGFLLANGDLLWRRLRSS